MQDEITRLNTIDLFAGMGGLSLGCARAGCNVVTAVENDKFALETHSKNFPAALHLNTDIAELKGRDLLRFSGCEKNTIAGIVGGPPCQGFSTMGRREKDDARNNLFGHFFRLVSEIQPLFFMAENVLGILDDKYRRIRMEALDKLSDYKILSPLIIKASDYGVPTTRTRVFFIGYKKEYFNEITEEMFAPPVRVQPVNVEQALYGLPKKISPKWLTEAEGWRKVMPPKNKLYAEKIAGEIPEGVGDQKGVELNRTKGIISGCLGTNHSDIVKNRYERLKPGERDKISRSVRLKLDGYCPTLRAGTGRDRGSYQAVRPIHPTEARVITPREAARLQGFPDWFVLHRTKWHGFRQIGNSVSPIVAEYILKKIISNLV